MRCTLDKTYVALKTLLAGIWSLKAVWPELRKRERAVEKTTEKTSIITNRMLIETWMLSGFG